MFRVAALVNNALDAALLNPPYYKKAVASGMKVLANVQEMDIPIQHIGLVTTRRFVSNNPDITRRLVKSLLRSLARLFQRRKPLTQRILLIRNIWKN